MNPQEFNTLIRSETDLWWFRGMRRILYVVLDAMAARYRGARVLEAGSGTGYMSRLLGARYQWRMTAVDYAWEGVSAFARHERVETVQADIAACPFSDGVFDGVVSLDVLVHFPKGEHVRALAEFARVVRAGGFLVLRVSALDILHSRHSIFTQERQRFERRRLMEDLRREGFTVLRCTYANSLLMPVALAKFRIWEPLTRQEPASGTAPVSPWLNKILELPLRLEAWALARGGRFPAGQSLILLAQRAPIK